MYTTARCAKEALKEKHFAAFAGVKLSTFDAAKKLLVVGEKAYADELAKAAAVVPTKPACCHQH